MWKASENIGCRIIADFVPGDTKAWYARLVDNNGAKVSVKVPKSKIKTIPMFEGMF